VGTHSAWIQEVISERGHEVLVANRRLMEGAKLVSCSGFGEAIIANM